MRFYKYSLVIFFFFVSYLSFAQPSNDDPCGAINIGALSVGTPKTHVGSNVGATTTQIFSTIQGGVNLKHHIGDVWFKFQLPAGYYSTKIVLTPSPGSNVKFTINTLSKHTCNDYSDMMSDPVLQQVGNYYTSTDAIASSAGEVLTSIRTFNSCKYVYSSMGGSYQPGDDIYVVVGGVTLSDQGSFTLSLEPYGISGGGCPTTSSCSANPGTFTAKLNGTVVTGNSYDLSTNDKLELISNNDFVLPPKAGSDAAGVGYAIFTCDPSTLDLTDKTIYSSSKSCYAGYQYSKNYTDINDGTSNSGGVQLGGLTTFWMVPITFDDACSPSKATADCKIGNTNIGIDINGDNCFKAGTPIKINYVTKYKCQTVDFEVQKAGVKTTNYNFTCSDNPVNLVALDPPSVALPDEWIYPGFILYIKPQSGSTWGASNTIDLLYNGSTAFTAQVLTDLTNGGLTNTDQYIFPVTFAQPGTFAFKINGVGATSTKKFDYIIFNAADGTIAEQGVISSSKTLTTSKSPVGTAHFSGPGVTDDPDNGGKGFFDPKAAGAGTHTITYSWDNGTGGTTNCKGTKSITVTVTGGPTITPTLSDVCSGATTTKLTYSTSGSPTTYTIDWNAAANTAGLVDVTDANLSTTSPMNINIPGTLAAGTYTGTLTAKNASGCSSSAQTVSFKVNPSPTITGPASICDLTTVEFTSTGTLTSSDPSFAGVVSSGTINKFNVSAYKPTTATTNLKLTSTLSGCTATKDLTINAKPTISGTLTLCAGATSQLSGSVSAAASNAWASATTSNASISTTGLVTAATNGNGNSVITYTDNNGCTNTATVSVNPNLAPTVECGSSTATSVSFTWNAVSNATSYDLVYNNNNAGDQAVTGHTTTSYTVPNVTAGKSVTIIVTPKGTGCFKASTLKSCPADACPTPVIDVHPKDIADCSGKSAVFSVTASSNPGVTLDYKWEVSTNGGVSFSPLTMGGVYSNATPNILTISDNTGLNNYQYRCIVTELSSGTGCNKTSLPATLTVNPIPTFTPTVNDICEGDNPSLSYTNMTGNPDKIIFDPGIPLVTPLNLTVSASPIQITSLPIKLPVNTYGGVKVSLENSTTGCKSSLITLPSFKVQATQQPSISSKATDVSSVTFQWADLIGLNTLTGANKDVYSIKEFICNGCTTPGTYTSATGTLTYNSTSLKWEYLINGLTPGDRVFIEVTPVDNTPLATPSCYKSSTFDLTAIQCDAPVITTDISSVSLCDGTALIPVSASFDLQYNSADATNPIEWQILTPGGSWSKLTISGIYSVTGTANGNSKLSISNISGLDGTKYRAQLNTATVGGTCNIVSNEVLLTVKPLPVMDPISDKSFCPGTKVNDPLRPIDFDFTISQSGTPTFTWVSDNQLTGVGVSNGSTPVTRFTDFITTSPLNEVISKITVTPTLDQCVGKPISFNIIVKPTIKPVNFTSVNDFNNVKFTWSTSSVLPDFWNIDTAITTVNAVPPTLAQYKNVTSPVITGATTEFNIGGINSNKKAYIIVTPKQDPSKTDLFCPASDGFSGIPTPCTKPTKPANPTISAVCEGAPITVNGINNDLTANYQWKISIDAGVTWNNVSFADFANTGTTNILSTQLSKAYMNNALVKVVLTDKQTGQCTEESNPVKLLVNVLPNVKLIQPSKTTLCIDDNDVSAFIQPIQGKSPLKVDYIFNNVTSTNQDISNLEIKFSAKSEANHTLSVTKVVDANNCESTLTGLTTLVSVHKNPNPSFAVSDTIGCYPLKINFTDISGEKFSDVTWDFGTGTNSSKDLGTATFTYQKQGDYTITYSVINEFGCYGEIVKVDKIHVKNSPKAVISTDRNSVNVYENVVQFSSKLSQNGTFYKWDFGDNSSFSNEPVVKHKYDPTVTGKFKVYLIVSNSNTNNTCSDTAITWIDFPEEVVYFIPNTFTPNGDEFNNTFQPIFTSGFDPQNYSFTIFDRWGQIVFESKNPTVGWDGTYGDKLLGNDTFVWKLGFKEKTNDNEHYTTGHVNLVK